MITPVSLGAEKVQGSTRRKSRRRTELKGQKMVTVCALTRADKCMRKMCDAGYAGGRNPLTQQRFAPSQIAARQRSKTAISCLFNSLIV